MSIDLINRSGGNVLGIVCLLNRSPKYDGLFPSSTGNIPIIAVQRRKIEEFQQSNPEVFVQANAGEIFHKPKGQKAEILAMMERAGPSATGWFKIEE